jgi:hypothetical protein
MSERRKKERVLPPSSPDVLAPAAQVAALRPGARSASPARRIARPFREGGGRVLSAISRFRAALRHGQASRGAPGEKGASWRDQGGG